MTKLAADTGDSLNEIAAALKVKGLHKKHTACLYGVEKAASRCTDTGPIVALLDTTIGTGAVEPVTHRYEEPDADPDDFGWERRPFVGALRDAGLPCSESLLDCEPYHPRKAPPPPWVKPFIGRQRARLADAAHMLAGLNPTDEASSDDETAISTSNDSVCEAIRAGEIALADGKADEELTDDTPLTALRLDNS